MLWLRRRGLRAQRQRGGEGGGGVVGASWWRCVMFARERFGGALWFDVGSVVEVLVRAGWKQWGLRSETGCAMRCDAMV